MFLRNITKKMLSIRVMIYKSNKVIFVYHDVSNNQDIQYSELYSTRTDLFYEQIEFIRKNFEIVSLDKIVNSDSSTKRLASITFDDGFYSVKKNAMPFLFAQKIPFAVFLNKNAIIHNQLSYQHEDGKQINQEYSEKVYLDKHDVKELYANDVKIGSHSSTHKILSEHCNETALHEEIFENKQFLEDLISEKVEHFALPYGKKEHFNKQVLHYCFDIGHKFVYTTNPIFFDNSILNLKNNVIPRIAITNETNADLTFFINRPLFKKINI